MSIMSMDRIMKHVKLRLGLKGLKLPIDDEDIVTIIEDETLETFSIYFPNTTFMNVNMETDRDKDNPRVFHLDVESLRREGIEVLSLGRITRRDFAGLNHHYYNNRGFDGMVEQQIASDMFSMENDFGTDYDFLPPNRLIVNRDPTQITDSGNIELECFVTHHKSLTTIKPTMKEGFKKLARLDVKIALWQLLKRYTRIQSTFGEIDLKIDDWENADQEREELLEQWEDLSMSDDKYRIFSY